VRRGRVLGECSNMARELSNEPSNSLTPREFARRSDAIAAGSGLSIEVLDEKEIERPGMGLLLGVARRSHEPPRLLVFRPGPAGATKADAEGRRMLGDGLWYARKPGATHSVDGATLSGAIAVALGKITSGLFGTPPAWVDFARRVADRAGDRVWPMPTFEEYG